eukprot:scaffold208088_cov24-Tisochrysis_lutea.AAC.1
MHNGNSKGKSAAVVEARMGTPPARSSLLRIPEHSKGKIDASLCTGPGHCEGKSEGGPYAGPEHRKYTIGASSNQLDAGAGKEEVLALVPLAAAACASREDAAVQEANNGSSAGLHTNDNDNAVVLHTNDDNNSAMILHTMTMTMLWFCTQAVTITIAMLWLFKQ